MDSPRRRNQTIAIPTDHALTNLNSPATSRASSLGRFMGKLMASPNPHRMTAQQVWDEFRESGPMSGDVFDETDALKSDIEDEGFDVIIDDGTRMRRRISLSTNADDLFYEEEDSIESDNESDETDGTDSTDVSDYGIFSTSLWKSWSRSPVTIGVLKCSIAYLLASMATFIPYINRIIGNGMNEHMVATVVVYFHPSKTMGGMVEATVFALCSFVFAIFVAMGSMMTAVWFNDHNLMPEGHVFILLFWCAGSIACIAYAKVNLDKPSFNTACSLCSIIIFVVLTKEGSVHLGKFSTTKILQVTFIVIIGVAICNAVCFGLWRKSAAAKLEYEIQKTMESFSLLLKLLTKTFLLDPHMSVTHDALKEAIASHRSAFMALQRALMDAKLEFANTKLQRSRNVYDELVRSMQFLAQHLMALRSSCGIQSDLIQHSHVDIMSRRKMRFEGIEPVKGELTALEDFIEHVGPHMKALAYTCKRTLIHLRATFHTPSKVVPVSFSQLESNLNRALELFEESQSQAILRLYKQKGEKNPSVMPFRDADEEISLIYFFAFNLQGFARELARLVDLTEVISANNEAVDRENEILRALPWYLRFSGIGWLRWKLFRKSPRIRRYSIFDRKPVDPKVNPFPQLSRNNLDTVQTPLPTTYGEKVKTFIWDIGRRLQAHDIKFAVKAGLASAILATPAFIDSTRPIFREYRMEWALVSFVIVLSPSVGATYRMALHRLLGTVIGCLVAFMSYSLFPENAYVLPWIGFFFSIPCFYAITSKPKYSALARFTLLSYNLVCLYAYNARKLHLPIYMITYHRAVAVGIGVVWGLIVTTYWWPYEARRELQKGLCDMFLNMGWLYNKLVAVYSTREDDETTAFKSQEQSIKDFMDMELFLQMQLIKLQNLLNETPNEPRLKGPFPTGTYRKVLTGCQNIMDKLLNIRLATTNRSFRDVRQDFIVHVSKERREMVGNILLFFFVLASSLRLKTPLPAYFPPVRAARDRLVMAIKQLPAVQDRFIGHNSSYIVYYAYALSMKDVTDELEKVGSLMQEMFGVVGGLNAFEDLFA